MPTPVWCPWCGKRALIARQLVCDACDTEPTTTRKETP